jgi:hypothetical protein
VTPRLAARSSIARAASLPKTPRPWASTSRRALRCLGASLACGEYRSVSARAHGIKDPPAAADSASPSPLAGRGRWHGRSAA